MPPDNETPEQPTDDVRLDQASEKVRGSIEHLFSTLTRTKAARQSLPLLFPHGIDHIRASAEVDGARTEVSIGGRLSLPPTSATASGLPNELTPGQRVPDVSEAAAVSAGTEVISRNSPEFARLVRNDNPDIVFKDEEKTAADRIMTPKLRDFLDQLAARVQGE